MKKQKSYMVTALALNTEITNYTIISQEELDRMYWEASIIKPWDYNKKGKKINIQEDLTNSEGEFPPITLKPTLKILK